MTKRTPAPTDQAADLQVLARTSIEVLGDQGQVATNVLLLPFGEYYGRDGRGPYILKDRDHAEAVIAATRAFSGQQDILFNYDHQSELAAVHGVGGQAKAAGWIDPASLSVADDGIHGEVSWTPSAESALAAREYRYHSPHFRVAKETRLVTRLVNAALTNSPNLDLPALASVGSAFAEGDPMKTISLAALAAALALKDDAANPLDEAGVLAAIDQLKIRADAGETVLASVRGELGLADDADEATVLASITTARAAGEPDPTKFVPIGALKDVQGRLAAIEDEKILAMVDQAVSAGKLTPAQKDWAIKLGQKDAGELQSFLGSAPVFAGGRQVEGQPGPEKGKLTGEERAICAQLGVTEADFLKSRDGETEERA